MGGCAPPASARIRSRCIRSRGASTRCRARRSRSGVYRPRASARSAWSGRSPGAHTGPPRRRLRRPGRELPAHQGVHAGEDGDGRHAPPDCGRAEAARSASGSPSRAISWPPAKIPTVAAGARGLQHFRSRPDLEPAAVTVSKASAPASQGDIFVAPQFGPDPGRPDDPRPQGQADLVRRQPAVPEGDHHRLPGAEPSRTAGADLVSGQHLSGSGRGEGVIFNDKYQEIATVRAANGLSVDLHEFEITPQGDAYVIATRR